MIQMMKCPVLCIQETLHMRKICVGLKGYRSAWVLLGTHPDDYNDDKIQSFIISYFVVDFIADTQQAAVVQVVLLSDDGGCKEGNGGDASDVVIGGERYMV